MADDAQEPFPELVFTLHQAGDEIIGTRLSGNEAFRFHAPVENQIMDFRSDIAFALRVHPLTLTFFSGERRLQDADRVPDVAALVVKKEAALPPLPVTFGEATGLPMKVRSASYTLCPAPALGRVLVKLKLEVVNEQVHGNISAKLRIPLPLEATVCRFRFERNGVWYPAVPVDASKAEEVVYKEREKGRSVAKASKAQGSLFEIEVFPLPFKIPARCELWFQTEAWLPLRFDADTVVTIDGQPLDDWRSPEGSRGGDARQEPGGVCVGECFGAKHFACFVPFVAPLEMQVLKRLAVIWDTSASQSNDHTLRFERLRALATECAAMTLDVFSFNVSFQRELTGASVDAAIEALQKLDYDGGTSFSLLPEILVQVGTVDAVLLFSDGMDNLDRRPVLENKKCPPIHCIVDQPDANVLMLRSLSLTTGGQLLQQEYLPILRTQPQARLTIEGSQVGFECCPDPDVGAPVNSEGLWISGKVGTATRIDAEVVVGSIRQNFSFDLTAAQDVGPEASPLIGYLYAGNLYVDIERSASITGSSIEQIRADLAVRYGLVTPGTSLLMLYDAGQFVDNKIGCPEDHPAHCDWERLTAPSTSAEVVKEEPKGDIGQPKTARQLEVVDNLAKQLRDYMEKPIVDIAPMQASKGGKGKARGKGMAMGAAPTGGMGKGMAKGAPAPKPKARVPTGKGTSWGMPGRAKGAADTCEFGADSGDDSDDAESRADDSDFSERGTETALSNSKRKKQKKAVKNRASNSSDSDEDEDMATEAMCQADSPPLPSGDDGHVRAAEVAKHIQGKEKEYLEALEMTFVSGQWETKYKDLKRVHGSSPSFFLYAASLVLSHGHKTIAIRICSNCLEFNINDVQMMRSVAYFLVKAGSLKLALALFDRVRDLAPVEPQSFLDGALARAFSLRQDFREHVLREALDLATHAVTHKWADRFSEIEWPALILLHGLVQIAEGKGITKNLWPLNEAWRCPSDLFHLGLFVWLGWDTDKTDIDLHVVEPSGEEVYYSHKRSRNGGHLSKDFTQGYGPEVYLCKQPVEGTYMILAKYYASHQQSGLTGTTSAIVWALQGGAKGEMQFDNVRLDTHQEKMRVMSVEVGYPAENIQKQ